ncbi:class I SAM-dependent methyltransferase [Aureivirga marina]|uniref:class I SAM-dependent methyltransferase n=1 Tax=Aureivirga marina TaxID=1182451 RepID=UPI0018CA2375|nr:class I SAM-dependent methyltransferase [Aureivirga marina]
MEKNWNQEYKSKWNERYQSEKFAYGKEPNQFFKHWILKLNPGKILLPADGEGRNGVFAAKNNWDVTAFDISEKGKEKALKLAQEFNVKIDYLVGEIDSLHLKQNSFDAIALIYAHVASDKKSDFHQSLNSLLKPDGIVIFEAFSKNHIYFNAKNPKVGGPKDLDLLFSKEEIKQDFKNYDILFLEEKEIELSEGEFHNGKGFVIRFVGKKR